MDQWNDTILYDWAQELNGVAVSLEHRYFGASKPFGNESGTNENLQYLTLENIMDDAVAFLGQVKENVTGAANAKVVMASGSYGGFLSGAFRLNRPEAIYGALASAGPTQGFGNSSDSDTFGWTEWANRVYQDKSHLASKNIKNAFQELAKQIKSENFSAIKTAFKLCDTANEETIPILPSVLVPIFFYSAEFDYPIPRPIVAFDYALEKTIAIAEIEEDPLRLLSRVAWLWLDSLDVKCLDVDPLTPKALIPYIEEPYFSYTVCNFFPLIAPGFVNNGTIFSPQAPEDSRAKNCQRDFGITPLVTEEINSRYHFSKDEIKNSTRIIWSKAEYDPASGVEPDDLGLSNDRMKSRTLFAPDTAHIEDLFRSDPSDREGIKWLRARELEIIKGWLDTVEEGY